MSRSEWLLPPFRNLTIPVNHSRSQQMKADAQRPQLNGRKRQATKPWITVPLCIRWNEKLGRRIQGCESHMVRNALLQANIKRDLQS